MSLNRALNGAEISCLASRMLADTGVHWLGVFARDHLPPLGRSQHRPFALVVNTDPADKPGAHWLAFFASAAAEPLEMFDSYGLLPDMHSLGHLAPRIYSSFTSYQSLDSSVCGHYCLFFLFIRAQCLSYFTIERMLRSHMFGSFSITLPTDAYVSRLIDSLQALYRIVLPCTRLTHSQNCTKKCFACYFC